MNTAATPQHLGGYIEGGDPATFFPELWKWCVSDLGVKSVLDVGCGEGHALKFFRRLGCEVRGVDGIAQDDPDIATWDFEKAPLADFRWGVYGDNTFDLVWTCEFVEHVEERYAKNLIPALTQGKILLITHAFPGQQGHHHVNCRESEYWKGFMAAQGFLYDQDLTVLTRSLASVNKNPYNHYVRSGMAFRRDR